MKSITVKPGEEGMTLLSFFKTRLKNYPSVKEIKRCIDRKQCTINGQVEIFSTYRLRLGDVVKISFDIEKRILPCVLFEDEALVAYNKPPRIVTEDLSSSFLVHRLDKDTSGVVIFAKTSEVQSILEDQFRKRKVKKNYLAICDGRVKTHAWTVDDFLKPKIRYQGGVIMGKTKKSGGKRAITHFKKLKEAEKATLLCVQPITGRTHQIRIHLKNFGHPILGDWQYSKQFTCPILPKRHMLHAFWIEIFHPTKGEVIKIKAPLLKDFLQVQKSLFSN